MPKSFPLICPIMRFFDIYLNLCLLAVNQLPIISAKKRTKQKMHFFSKKIAKIVGSSKNSSTFAVAIEQTMTP